MCALSQGQWDQAAGSSDLGTSLRAPGQLCRLQHSQLWHCLCSEGILLAAPAQGRAAAGSAQKLPGAWDELAAPQEKSREW